MKLKYKISLVMATFSLFVVVILTLFYLDLQYKQNLNQIKIKLLQRSNDSAFHIKSNLLEKLNLVKTIASAYIVEDFLLKDNDKYIGLASKQIDEKISYLNTKWMNTDDENSPFVKQYIDNKLAKYLKKQKKLFEGLYGEIFITNKYGAMIATTGKLTTLKHNQKYWWKECYDYGYGKVFFDDRGFDESVKGYVLGIVVPIRKDGKIIGVIKANINIQSLLDDEIKKYDNNFEKIKIVRTKGLIVYEKNFPPLTTRVPKRLTKKIEIIKNDVFQMKIFGKPKIVAFAPIQLSLDVEDIIFGGKRRGIDHILGSNGEIWYVLAEEDASVVLNSVLSNIKEIFSVSLGFILFIVLFLFAVVDKISAPLNKLSMIAKRVGRGEKNVRIEPESDDEVGELAIAFRDMLKNLQKTTASRDEFEQEVRERIKAQEELKKKDEVLIAQSKQAAMGEMISMIAHQWRQPVAVISMAVNNILVDIELDLLKEENIKECSQDILNETTYLSQTIEDFRNFFKPNKEKEKTGIQKLYNDAYKIIGKSFENNNIELKFSKDVDIDLYVYASELSQVFINILNNAKDAMEEKKVQEKRVVVSEKVEENFITFRFCDNGGGIKEENIDKIFDPYFSTKDEKNGTGIGLYMCKLIIEKHMLGKIWVENSEYGACFMVKLPISQIKD